MSTSQTNISTPKMDTPITRKVFDLASFDNVDLVKPFPAREPVHSVEQALAALNNDVPTLLSVINEGLRQQARDAAYADITGFLIVNDDGTTGDQYQGSYADEAKSKLINGAVLNLAKMFAGGAWDSATKEQKRAHKDSAIAMIRANPAMLQSIQG